MSSKSQLQPLFMLYRYTRVSKLGQTWCCTLGPSAPAVRSSRLPARLLRPLPSRFPQRCGATCSNFLLLTYHLNRRSATGEGLLSLKSFGLLGVDACAVCYGLALGSSHSSGGNGVS